MVCSRAPLLFQEQPVLMYGIFIAMLLSNLVMLIEEFFGLRIFVSLLKTPKYILLPIIFAVGTEKGRAGYYVVLFGGMILATASEELTSLTGYTPEAVSGSLLALLPAAVYVLSWRIAIRLYEKRSL